MKVGSLVVCVDDRRQFGWLKKPLIKGKIYTVEGIKSDSAIYLEESNEPHIDFNNIRVAHRSVRFRELDTPQSISIEEILEEQVYA